MVDGQIALSAVSVLRLQRFSQSLIPGVLMSGEGVRRPGGSRWTRRRHEKIAVEIEITKAQATLQVSIDSMFWKHLTFISYIMPIHLPRKVRVTSMVYGSYEHYYSLVFNPCLSFFYFCFPVWLRPPFFFHPFRYKLFFYLQYP